MESSLTFPLSHNENQKFLLIFLQLLLQNVVIQIHYA